MRPQIGVLLAALVFLGVGCSSQTPSPATGGNVPPPIPGSVAATDWRPAEDPPEGFGPGATRFASPQALLRSLMEYGVRDEGGLAEGMRLQGDILETGGATAVAWIQVTGMQDDSIAGSEIRLELRNALAGWYVERLTWRDHCRRGVDRDAGLCL